MKYIMYLRRSSESEDRQALSIPAQEAELRELAERRGLDVLGEPLRESMSAKKPGRPLFGEMIDALNRKKVQGILCWHGDRLARNPLDGGALIWMLGQGGIAEIVTPSKTFTGGSDDKFLLALTFGMATKYSDDLSQNVKRGNLAAVRQGNWPSAPKFGYLRDRDTNRIVADPARFDICRDLIWDAVYDGEPVAEILRRLRREGVTTRIKGRVGGRPPTRTLLYKILRDPFYTGQMLYNGELYPGNHPVMVSIEKYEAVQRRLRERVIAPGREHDVPLRGLVRCADCGAQTTVDRQTRPKYGRTYEYLRCTRKTAATSPCRSAPVGLRHVESEIEKYLSGLALPSEVEAAAFEGALAEVRQTRDHDARRQQLEAAQKRVTMQHENVRKLASDGTFDPADYRAERNRLMAESARITQQLAKLAEGDGTTVEHNRPALSLGELALRAFRTGSNERKRRIVQLTTSNISIRRENVSIKPKALFARLLELARCKSTWASGDTNTKELTEVALGVLQTPRREVQALLDELSSSEPVARMNTYTDSVRPWASSNKCNG